MSTKSGKAQFYVLFGIETTRSFKTPEHLSRAKHLYRMYDKNKDDKEAGIEYDILMQWAKDLKLTKYFTLIHESKYREEKRNPEEKRSPEENKGTVKDSIEDIINKVQEDPFNLEDRDEENRIDRVRFDVGSPQYMAVVMYCVDALKYFEGKSKEEVQKVAFEIAMLGTYGLTPGDPEQKYTLSSIPNKKFSALHLLSFEFVGFQLIDPSLDTTLDFQEELIMAKQIYKK